MLRHAFARQLCHHLLPPSRLTALPLRYSNSPYASRSLLYTTSSHQPPKDNADSQGSQASAETNVPPDSHSVEHTVPANQLDSEHISPGRSSAYTHFSNAPQTPREEHTTPPNDPFTRIRSRIQEWTTNAAIQTRLTADDLVVRLTHTLSKAGGEINRVTGYEQIDALKRRVIEQEARMAATRLAAREAKDAFERSVQRRSASQKEVNDLLQRKSTWSDTDVSRFTELVRADHQIEQAESRARVAAETAEDAVEREFSTLMRAILDRYHEEQVWSDKIRSVSTYGSLAVVAINLFVFVIAIIIVEPWKRRRLAQTFERKVEELEREHLVALDSGIRLLQRKIEEQNAILDRVAAQGAIAHPSDTPVQEPTLAVEDVESSMSSYNTEKLLIILHTAACATTIAMALFNYLSR